MMAVSEKEVICWQCSEHHINFTYVLNVIAELKKKKISANLKNIEERLNAGEDF